MIVTRLLVLGDLVQVCFDLSSRGDVWQEPSEVGAKCIDIIGIDLEEQVGLCLLG